MSHFGNAPSWPGQSDFHFILITKKDWIDRNPEAAKRFLRSTVEAEEYSRDNSEEAKEFVKNRFGYEPDYIDYSWPKQKFTVILTQSMILAFEDMARWRIYSGLSSGDIPNYLNYIYIDALEEIKPDAVTVIR